MAEFSGLNTVGSTRDYTKIADGGGNGGRGPIDNVLPTGVVARGNEVSARDGFDRGERRGLGITRMTSKARMGSDRR